MKSDIEESLVLPETVKINEIFYSIQGESSLVGYPTVFIRTSGCHLRCTYCDTTYAYNEGEHLSIEEIIGTVKSYDPQYVCVTGGEPMLQKNIHTLLKTLCDMNYTVSLETSGDKDCSAVDERVRKIIDIKTPDSGEKNKFHQANLSEKIKNDVKTEYKFVICSMDDFDWAEEFCLKYDLFRSSRILYSPSYNKINEKWLAEKIISKNSKARLQLQLHKYIWNAQQRGV